MCRCRVVLGIHDGVSASRCSRWVVGRLVGCREDRCWCRCWWETCSGDVTSCRMWKRRMAMVDAAAVPASAYADSVAAVAGIGRVASRLWWKRFGTPWCDSTSRRMMAVECWIGYRFWMCSSETWWANCKIGRCWSLGTKYWVYGCFVKRVDSSSRSGVSVCFGWIWDKTRKGVVNWMWLWYALNNNQCNWKFIANENGLKNYFIKPHGFLLNTGYHLSLNVYKKGNAALIHVIVLNIRINWKFYCTICTRMELPYYNFFLFPFFPLAKWCFDFQISTNITKKHNFLYWLAVLKLCN